MFLLGPAVPDDRIPLWFSALEYNGYRHVFHFGFVFKKKGKVLNIANEKTSPPPNKKRK